MKKNLTLTMTYVALFIDFFSANLGLKCDMVVTFDLFNRFTVDK